MGQATDVTTKEETFLEDPSNEANAIDKATHNVTLEEGGNSLAIPEKEGGDDFLAKRNALQRNKSVLLTPEKKLMVLLLRVWDLTNGLSHVTNQLFPVYLVAIVGWTPLMSAYLSVTSRVTAILVKPIFGNIIDRVKLHKWTILILSALMKVGSGTLMVVQPIFGLLLFRSVIEGVRGVGDAAKNAMNLGTAGKTRFHKKYVATNIILNHCGKVIGSLILIPVSYDVWPNVRFIFMSVVISGSLMIVCVLLMPKKNNDGSDVVDHRLARGRSVVFKKISNMKSVHDLRNPFTQDESDDEMEDEGDNWQPVSHRNTNVDPGKLLTEGLEGPTYTQVMSFKQMYSDPKRRRSLILLSLAFFTFHWANATTAPLLNQYMAINSDNPRDGIPIAGINTLINQLVRIAVTWSLSDGRASTVGYSNLLIIGGLALCVRLVVISVLVTYYPNYWALSITSILNGIGGACYGLMANLYSHLLSRRTGQYNLNMAMVSAAGELGDIVGFLAGGAIATVVSYKVAFYALAVVSLFPGFFAFFIVTPDLQRLN